MLTKVERYQSLIENSIKRISLFPKVVNQGKKPIAVLQTNAILPSSYPFRSSQQINNYMPIIHQIIHHQKPKQYTQNTPTSLKNEWPQSCIGLVLCEHHQNNQIYYIYGTGTLIHNKIVLTSAKNVYCRRLNKQYVNVKFITGVNGNKCSGIYDVKQVNYPKEYTMQQEYKNYNFAILYLYDDLSDNCGYVGWKTSIKPHRNIISYALMIDNNNVLFFKLYQIRKTKQLEFGYQDCSGSGVLMKGKEGNYYIVGINNLSQIKQYSVLSEKMRNLINQWISETTIDLRYENIGQLSIFENNQFSLQQHKCLRIQVFVLIQVDKLNLDQFKQHQHQHIRMQISQPNQMEILKYYQFKFQQYKFLGVQLSESKQLAKLNLDLFKLEQKHWFIRVQVSDPSQLATFEKN